MEFRTEFDDMEDQRYAAATTWNDSGDEACENFQSIMRKLSKLRKEAIALQTRLDTGGRNRTQPQKSHEFYQWVIRGDLYGFPAYTDDNGVHHPSKPAYDSEYAFNKRFC